MNNIILPVGLKGNEITERMKELMGVTSINENKKTSVLELTKMGPDGNIYGVVRENHEYYIKTTSKKSNLVVEDFSYIGGLQNKKQEAYPSYAKAIKHLNLKFNSLNEAFNKSGQINVFENDNLESDDMENTSSNDDAYSKAFDTMSEEEISTNDEQLSEVEQDVEDMLENDETKVEPVKEHRLSINRAINDMDNIIDSIVTGKKKVYTIK